MPAPFGAFTFKMIRIYISDINSGLCILRQAADNRIRFSLAPGGAATSATYGGNTGISVGFGRIVPQYGRTSLRLLPYLDTVSTEF